MLSRAHARALPLPPLPPRQQQWLTSPDEVGHLSPDEVNAAVNHLFTDMKKTTELITNLVDCIRQVAWPSRMGNLPSRPTTGSSPQ